MRQVILNVPDNKFPFFMKLINHLDFVKMEREDTEPSKAEILQGITEGLEQAKQYRQGKIKLKSFDEFLNEL